MFKFRLLYNHTAILGLLLLSSFFLITEKVEAKDFVVKSISHESRLPAYEDDEFPDSRPEPEPAP